jgi:hypothetical protein
MDTTQADYSYRGVIPSEAARPTRDMHLNLHFAAQRRVEERGFSPASLSNIERALALGF